MSKFSFSCLKYLFSVSYFKSEWKQLSTQCYLVYSGAGKVVQQVREIAIKPEVLSSVLRTYPVEGGHRCLQVHTMNTHAVSFSAALPTPILLIPCFFHLHLLEHKSPHPHR